MIQIRKNYYSIIMPLKNHDESWKFRLTLRRGFFYHMGGKKVFMSKMAVWLIRLASDWSIFTDSGRSYVQNDHGEKIEYVSKRHCFGQMNEVVNRFTLPAPSADSWSGPRRAFGRHREVVHFPFSYWRLKLVNLIRSPRMATA